MQKGFVLPLVLVGILLIGLLGAGGYYFYQTNYSQNTPIIQSSPQPQVKDETANWKTYKDEKYGFSFKYPSSTNIKIYPEEVATATPDLAIQLNNITTEDVAEKQILLFIYETSIEDTVGKKVQQLKNQWALDKNFKREVIQEESKMGDIDAITLYITFPSGTKSIETFFIYQGYVYDFSINYQPQTEEQIVNIYKDILSTFTFN